MTSETDRMQACVDGRRAAENGVPHSANPHPSRDFELHLAWSNAWLVRKVEIDEQCKLQVESQEGTAP
jgi:hypothetical protein